MDTFPKSEHTTITRLPKRGAYDKPTIYSILDEALVCTLAFQFNGIPFQIPTGFCRIDDSIFIHGSVGSTYMRNLVAESPMVSVGVTLLDGMVLARSAFHHSVNYRSVVLFSHPKPVEELERQAQILEVFTNKMQPGRWDDVRKPDAGEWKATLVLELPIEEASAKIRTGDPKDDQPDYELPVWAGVVPLTLTRGTPVPDSLLKPGINLPAYL